MEFPIDEVYYLTQEHELARQDAEVCRQSVQIDAAGQGTTFGVETIPVQLMVARRLRTLTVVQPPVVPSAQILPRVQARPLAGNRKGPSGC